MTLTTNFAVLHIHVPTTVNIEEDLPSKVLPLTIAPVDKNNPCWLLRRQTFFSAQTPSSMYTTLRFLYIGDSLALTSMVSQVLSLIYIFATSSRHAFVLNSVTTARIDWIEIFNIPTLLYVYYSLQRCLQRRYLRKRFLYALSTAAADVWHKKYLVLIRRRLLCSIGFQVPVRKTQRIQLTSRNTMESISVAPIAKPRLDLASLQEVQSTLLTITKSQSGYSHRLPLWNANIRDCLLVKSV